jgi:hypothetical protein
MTDWLQQRSNFWGIDKKHGLLLVVITAWINGVEFETDAGKRHIGRNRDPKLNELCRWFGTEYSRLQEAHESLLQRDVVEEKYVCRRKVDWAPTSRGRKVIREVLHPQLNDIEPRWADEDDRGPLYGDPNAGVIHRKGVEIANNMFPGMAWAYEIGGRPYGVQRYPTDNGGKSCHDIHIDTEERWEDVGVEVITNNNNRDRLVKKWKRFQSENRLTFWIFDERQTACKLWNELHDRGVTKLDGRFSNKSNWSAEAINQKIWRSSKQYNNKLTKDIVQTVTGLFEGDKDTIQNLFRQHQSER